MMKLPIAALVYALLFSSGFVQAATLIFKAVGQKNICVGHVAPASRSQCDLLANDQSVDIRTKNILNRSDETIPVFTQSFKNGDYLVFVARIPSKSPQSKGFCGAGYEDHLVLLSYDGKTVAFRDDFLLQSCLKSIALASDNGDDILRSLSIDQLKHQIQFRWLTEPDDKNHVMTILNGKFSLN